MTKEQQDAVIQATQALFGEECDWRELDQFVSAVSLIHSLDESIPPPEVCLDNEGRITLDWTIRKDRRFTVSIGSVSSATVFAWFYEGSKGYGVEASHVLPRRSVFRAALRAVVVED